MAEMLKVFIDAKAELGIRDDVIEGSPFPAKVMVDPDSAHKNKWVKMGNVAMQPNKYLHQVALQVTKESKDMYSDEATWKSMVKNRLAEALAKEIVGTMTFTQMTDDFNGTLTVFGRVYIMPMEQMDPVFESTTFQP